MVIHGDSWWTKEPRSHKFIDADTVHFMYDIISYDRPFNIKLYYIKKTIYSLSVFSSIIQFFSEPIVDFIHSKTDCKEITKKPNIHTCMAIKLAKRNKSIQNTTQPKHDNKYNNFKVDQFTCTKRKFVSFNIVCEPGPNETSEMSNIFVPTHTWDS